MRVMVGLLEEGQLLADDNGTTTAFNTSIHNPFDSKQHMHLPDNTYIQLTKTSPEF
jgi:hypothetical protein